MGRDEDDFVIAPDGDGRRVVDRRRDRDRGRSGQRRAWVLLDRPGREPTAVVPPVIEPSQPTTTAPASEATSATAATETATPGEATPTVPGGQESTGTPVALSVRNGPLSGVEREGTVYIAREEARARYPS